MLPTIQAPRRRREIVYDFAGLNLNEVAGRGEFLKLDNVEPCEFAAIRTRKTRANFRVIPDFGGMLGKERLFWIEDGGIWYDGGRYGDVTAGDKQLVSMGGYVLVFPDKLCFNTDTKIITSLENARSITGNITVQLARYDGTPYTGYTTSASPPSNPTNGMLWMDTNNGLFSLKEYSGATEQWVSVASTYLAVQSTNIGVGFKAGDGVNITGLNVAGASGDAILVDVTNNRIVIKGVMTGTHTQTGGMTIKREVPDMDYYASMNNRVWGCSTKNHEIYACKLGDPTNWRSYEGLSTDSYAATVGSDGAFTGAAHHLSSVLFFKEGCVHKLFGDAPGNFQISEINFRGVERGSEKSICVVNEILYYKSPDGVMGYDGTIPRDVGARLGPYKYTNARAGRNGSDLYMCMEHGGKYTFFVLDTTKGVWRTEGDIKAKQFTDRAGNGYYVEEDTNKLVALNSAEGSTIFDDPTPEDIKDISWQMETHELFAQMPDFKHTARIQITSELKGDAEGGVYLTDESGIFSRVGDIEEGARRMTVVRVPAMRNTRTRLMIAGKGSFTLYAMSMFIESGSDSTYKGGV